jgi:hypothetical protein
VTICCNRAAPSVPLDLLGCYGFSRDLPRNELGVSPIKSLREPEPAKISGSRGAAERWQKLIVAQA